MPTNPNQNPPTLPPGWPFVLIDIGRGIWNAVGGGSGSTVFGDFFRDVRNAQRVNVPQVVTAGGFGVQGAVDVSGPTRPIVIGPGGEVGQSGALPSRAPPSADTIPGPRSKGPRARFGRKGKKFPKGGQLGALLYVLAESVSETAADDTISDAEYQRRFGKGPKLENIKVTASRIAYPRPLTRIKVTAQRVPERQLERIKVTAKKIPRVPAPRSTRTPLWQRALPYVIPPLLEQLRPQPKIRLTVSNAPSAPLPQPQPQPQPRPQPQPQPLPGLASYSNYGGFIGSSSSSCECPPKRKRKPKSKRTICYSGTYSDKANGLRKTKKRKIPCK